MSVSLYDVSITNYLQILNAVEAFLEKSKTHFAEQSVDLDEIVQTRLIDDMSPFRFQIISVAHHSMGAIKGIESGSFAPPNSGGYGEPDYAGLQALVADAKSYLENCTKEQVEELGKGNLIFKLGDNELPFTAENFILSFSLPNFYFHATTAYDLLRMKGAPLGKRDFLGSLRMGI